MKYLCGWDFGKIRVWYWAALLHWTEDHKRGGRYFLQNGSLSVISAVCSSRTAASDDRSDFLPSISSPGQTYWLLVQLWSQEKYGKKHSGAKERHGEELCQYKNNLILYHKSLPGKKKVDCSDWLQLLCWFMWFSVHVCVWQTFVHVLRWTAWVLIHCPLLCSYHVFGYTQQNGQLKQWVIPNQSMNAHQRYVCHSWIWQLIVKFDNIYGTRNLFCLHSLSLYRTLCWHFTYINM